MNLANDLERLTAYALGELDDAEREAVEKALETDKTARELVDELRGTARFAGEALKAQPAAALAQEQRQAIERQAATARPNPVQANLRKKRRRTRWGMLAITAAAATLLVVVATPNLLRSRVASTDGMPAPIRSYHAPRPRSNVRLLSKEELHLTRGGSPEGMTLVEHEPEPSAPMEVLMAEANDADIQGPAGKLVAGRTTPCEVMRQPSIRQSDTSDHPDFMNDPSKVYWPEHNTEAYDRIVENPFLDVAQNPLSTFSIDVDTASYANARRFLNHNALPPKGAVRIEELVNYFSYDYTPPDVAPDQGGDPFASHVEVVECPWQPAHRLARIGLKGWEMPADQRPPTNLVFLLDVSGSMSPENKLPLVKAGMKLLVQQLGENDRIAIVVYAGASGLVLPSTSGDNQEAILDALDRLQSGGSTNGGQGIKLAYDTAVANFIKGGVNRVILCTDGDFNVGLTDQSQLVSLIEQKAKTGVFLTVLGFGMGNVKDSTLEKLADKGNGNYGYVDSMREARKTLVEEMAGTLVTIAKDVKIQVEFNPALVRAYRLIGYENRILAAEDFNDDTKDAGEIGAGHTVTALYELVPAGAEFTPRGVDPLKYQQGTQLTQAAANGELFTLKLRYKQPDGDTSKLLTFPVRNDVKAFDQAPKDVQFAAAVAGFGMLLRESEYKGHTTFDQVRQWANAGLGADPHGHRAEFLDLVMKAQALKD